MRLRRHAALALVTMLLVAAPARAASPGDLDRSFGHNGKVKTVFDCRCRVQAVAIDSRGRIVAVGGAPNDGNSDFALARYKADGSLDPSFSGDGQVTTDFVGGGDVADSVASDSQGRIVAAGCWDKPGSAAPESGAASAMALWASPDTTLTDDSTARSGEGAG